MRCGVLLLGESGTGKEEAQSIKEKKASKSRDRSARKEEAAHVKPAKPSKRPEVTAKKQDSKAKPDGKQPGPRSPVRYYFTLEHTYAQPLLLF